MAIGPRSMVDVALMNTHAQPEAAFQHATVLVTGATGFIGYHVCERLARSGIVTFGLSRSAGQANLPRGVKPLAADITRYTDLSAALQQAQPACVIHLAAAGVAAPTLPINTVTHTNLDGTQHVLQASLSVGVQRLVYVGTAYECDTAQSSDVPYVVTKRLARAAWQTFITEHTLDSVAVRLYHVFGPRQSARSLIGGAIRAALHDEIFPMTSGQQLRDFVYVGDVVDALLAAANAHNVSGKTYDIGTGIGRPVLAVAQTIFRLADSRGHLQPGTLPYRPGENLRMIANTEPAAQDLGWRAQTDFEDGLLETIAYQREYGDAN